MGPEDEQSPAPTDDKDALGNTLGGPDRATNVPTNSELSNLANQGESSALEAGVSWVYRLRKEELTQELGKFRLNPSGTVDEQRKRLVTFLRVGRTSPQPQRAPSPFIFDPPPPISVPAVTVATTTKLDPLSIRKWNIRFNGKGDPSAFIERLDEICGYTNFSHDQLLTVIPELLEGTPLLWYRNNKRFWRTWNDFVRDFRTSYFPVNYLEDLEAEIGRRLQRADEPVVTYITELQTLIRRHGEMTPEQELRWLYRNLLPDYRQYIRKTDFTDLRTLIMKVKEFETLRKEVQQMYSHPHHRAVPTTRLHERTQASFRLATTDARPMQASSLPAPVARERRPPPPHESLLPPQPSTSRQSTRPSNQDTAPDRRTSSNRSLICWRCGEAGHLRTQCRARPKLFCSRCGREGIMSKDCNCRQSEN